MADSLQEELKSIEKDLSLLLVRFMKVCDAVERSQRPSRRPAKASAVEPAPAPRPPSGAASDPWRAYA